MKIFTKKMAFILLSTSITAGALLGCGSESNSKQVNGDAKTTEQKQSASENKEATNNTNSNVQPVNNQPVQSKDIDINKLKEDLSMQLGNGETMKDISEKDISINLKVDLGQETNGLTKEDLAYSRCSSLTELLLSKEKWTSITIDFIGVGKVTLTNNQVVTKEISGKQFKYFPTETIMKNFKKY